MKTKILAAIIANLFASAALAQSATDASYVELGLIGTNVNSGNEAKFNEYRDMRDGVIGSLNLDRKWDKYGFNLWIENPGRDDQLWQIQGQQYGKLKYSATYNEIIHNFSSDARTFYSGVGGGVLDYPNSAGYPRASGSTYTPDPLVSNVNAWGTTFDYKLKRKDLGAGVEYRTSTPWYFSVNVNQEDRGGIKRLSSPSGVCVDRTTLCTSSFGNIVELPAPVDYRTSTASGEVGYNTKPMNFSVRYTVSQFTNNYQNLVWKNPYVTSQNFFETTTQPPDNDFKNLSIQGAARQLPWNSAVTFRGNYAKFSNDISLLTSAGIPGHLSAATTAIPYGSAQVLPTGTRFRGNIEYKSASVAWTAQPMSALDTRVYLNWVDKVNHSSELTYTDPAGTTSHNELFTYKKNDAGVDIGYRVRRDAKVMAGYQYTSLHRERIDFDETNEQRIYGEFKYTGWEWGGIRAKYQSVQRTANFVASGQGTSDATDQAYMNRYIGRYDANGKDEDSLRIVLNASPRDLLDLGAEYIYKTNKYKPAYGGVILGRTKDVRDQWYLTAAYGPPDGVRLSAYADIEYVKYDSYHRNPGMSRAAGSFDPNTAPATASGWNWSQSQRDRNWAIGAGVEWPIKSSLKLVGSLGYERTDGTMEFASQTNTLGVPFSLDQKIPYWDTYNRQFVNFKLMYKQNTKLDWTFGIAHQKLDYQDNMFMSYRNVVSSAASGEPNAYLTGYANDLNYSANTIYVVGKYSF